MVWEGLDHRLRAEVTKSHSLEKELNEVKATLLKESDEHDALCVTVQLVCDDLELAPAQEMSSLVVHAVRIMDRMCEMARDALRFGVHRSFTIAHSHYENIDLEMMRQGFTLGYSDAKLKGIEKEVAPLAQDLSTKIEDAITPLKIS